MRINPPVPSLQPGAARATRRARSSTGGFALPDTGEDAEADAAGAAVPQGAGLSGATCLLAEAAGSSGAASAAQANTELSGGGHGLAARETPADKAAARQGRALLGALAGLQLVALGGGGVEARQTLSDLARALQRTTDPQPDSRLDPRLDEVLRAIAQRAAIELARGG